MRILCVATKPPWPPSDGGRLALALTLQGLAEAGHEIHLIAPASNARVANANRIDCAICVEEIVVPRIAWPLAAARALHRGQSLSVARHHHAEVERAVGEVLTRFRPDIVHAEQLQALANCSAALSVGVPVVLRMQNVESDLWRQTAAARALAWPLGFEANRLQAEERGALTAATHTLALTESDAAALRRLHPSAAMKIGMLPPAFPQRLPAGRAVEGDPAISLSGSAGWWPNHQAARWFLREVLPRISLRLPRAVVHVFGGDPIVPARNLRWHPAPAESIDAFPEGAIAAVPLFVGSGIRMRILEAWARGLPVVATSKAASGLDVVGGRELSIADTPDEFCAALCALAASPDMRAAHVDAGRAYLARRHDPVQATLALLDIYQQAIAQKSATAR